MNLSFKSVYNGLIVFVGMNLGIFLSTFLEMLADFFDFGFVFIFVIFLKPI